MTENIIVAEGEVSSVDYSVGTVCVTFPDRADSVSAPLPMFNSEYKMPDVGDTVVCLFLSTNPARGYCLGTPELSPAVPGEGIFYKNLFGKASIKYDKSTDTLTINAGHVIINGKDFISHTHSSPEGGQTGPVS